MSGAQLEHGGPRGNLFRDGCRFSPPNQTRLVLFTNQRRRSCVPLDALGNCGPIIRISLCKPFPAVNGVSDRHSRARLLPGCLPAPFRRRIDAMVLQNVGDCASGDFMSEVEGVSGCAGIPSHSSPRPCERSRSQSRQGCAVFPVHGWERHRISGQPVYGARSRWLFRSKPLHPWHPNQCGPLRPFSDFKRSI